MAHFPHKIAIGGPDGAGKSTLLRRLSHYTSAIWNSEIPKRSFGDEVREELLDLNFSKEMYSLYGYLLSLEERDERFSQGLPVFRREEVYAKPTSARVRTALRDLGTVQRRAIDENYWVSKLESRIFCRTPDVESQMTSLFLNSGDLSPNSYGNDDMRFLNEALLFRQDGALLIYLDDYRPYDRSVPSYGELHLVKAVSHITICAKPEFFKVIEAIESIARLPYCSGVRGRFSLTD